MSELAHLKVTLDQDVPWLCRVEIVGTDMQLAVSRLDIIADVDADKSPELVLRVPMAYVDEINVTKRTKRFETFAANDGEVSIRETKR